VSLAAQLIVPFIVALLLLGIFHLIAYLHLQLSGQVDPANEREAEKP